ncbi:MAG: metallophosphoesterase [Oscillospiraceae bacterium]|nr:metallophosphoesterase [Oscillospiraceae bacterium]
MRKKTKMMLSLLLCAALLLTSAPMAVAMTQNEDAAAVIYYDAPEQDSEVFVVPVAAPIAAPARMQIAVISDTHHFSPTQAGYFHEAFFEYVNPSGARMLRQSKDVLYATLAAVAANPDVGYLLVAGDLTREGELPGHQSLSAMLRTFQQDTGIQVIVVPGNHDVNAYRGLYFGDGALDFAFSIDAPTFWAMYQDLGPHLPNMERFVPRPVFYPGGYRFGRYRPAGYYAEAGGYLSYAVDLAGGAFRLIALDSVKHSPDQNPEGFYYSTSGMVGDDLLNWAVQQAQDAVARGQIPLVMMHHTLSSALPGVAEGRGMNVNFTLDGGLHVAETLADAGVRFAFTGHAHTHSNTRLISDSGNVIYDISTGSVVNYPATFREVEIIADARDDIIVDVRMQYADYVQDVRRRADYRNAAYYAALLGRAVSPGDVIGYYPSPFAITSFAQSYAVEDMPAFALTFVSGALMPIYRAGGLRSFLDDGDMSLEQIVADALGGNFIARRLARNINSFAMDLIDQVDYHFIIGGDDSGRDIRGTLNLLSDVVEWLFGIEISSYPSQKFHAVYNIGDPNRPGTLGDLVGEGLLYQYGRHPDAEDNPFLMDVLARATSGELIDQLLDEAIGPVLELLDEQILSVLEINLSSIFLGRFMRTTVGRTIDFFFRLFLGGENTFAALVSRILGIANFFRLIPANDIPGLVEFLLELILTEQLQEALSFTLSQLLLGFISDIDDVPDLAVTLHYTGPLTPLATQANGRLPSHFVQQLPVQGQTFCRVFSWYTKQTVMGTDIRVWNASGVDVTNSLQRIATSRERVAKELYGIDLGIIGMRAITSHFNRHRIELSGLQPGSVYTFQVGDAQRDWWTPVGTLTTAARDEAPVFLTFGAQQAMTPQQYQDGWGRLSAAALAAFPQAAFATSAGERVANTTNFDQWQWFFDHGHDALVNLPLMPATVSSEQDAMGAFFPQQQQAYAFIHGNMFVMMLDASDVSVSSLRRDMRDADAQWNVAVLAQPPGSRLRRRLYSAGVDLILHGDYYCAASFGVVRVVCGRVLRHEIWEVDARGVARPRG